MSRLLSGTDTSLTLGELQRLLGSLGWTHGVRGSGHSDPRSQEVGSELKPRRVNKSMSQEQESGLNSAQPAEHRGGGRRGSRYKRQERA